VRANGDDVGLGRARAAQMPNDEMYHTLESAKRQASGSRGGRRQLGAKRGRLTWLAPRLV
jgi:hypothetical protein